ncbi:hypothetical protein MRB53_001983 [Persea americana]|uniref:Uncharacterized protein n=1 Tax=Persea americana TaxID=3435 RepID=A0ACC2MTI1_PERAE|nr:hypothetical protein MRB53_001983 [Persea americana]
MYKETFLAHYYEIANLDHHQRWDPQEFHYICSEWNLGGFLVWLKYIPGISFRTDNEPFKRYMAGFTKKIVEMMKAESLFEPQGGPIIMSQVIAQLIMVFSLDLFLIMVHAIFSEQMRRAVTHLPIIFRDGFMLLL